MIVVEIPLKKGTEYYMLSMKDFKLIRALYKERGAIVDRIRRTGTKLERCPLESDPVSVICSVGLRWDGKLLCEYTDACKDDDDSKCLFGGVCGT